MPIRLSPMIANPRVFPSSVTDYQRGYEAGLNGCRFDMAMKNNQDYLDGWNAGWKKRYFRTRVEG